MLIELVINAGSKHHHHHHHHVLSTATTTTAMLLGYGCGGWSNNTRNTFHGETSWSYLLSSWKSCYARKFQDNASNSHLIVGYRWLCSLALSFLSSLTPLLIILYQHWTSASHHFIKLFHHQSMVEQICNHRFELHGQSSPLLSSQVKRPFAAAGADWSFEK